jgi:prepilin-type N-terminal cleavage/methylation domain-containing protein
MCTDRGFTLIEVLIAVGLVALVAVGAVGATLSSRSMAVTTAAAGFDSLLDAARTTAREFPNGATIAFTRDAYGDGFIARLYHNRPGTAPLEASTIPAVEGRVPLTETATLGSPAFAIAIHAGGTIAGIIGPVTSGSAAAETPCPASGAYHLVFSYAGSRAERTIPCRINLATTGPPTFSTFAPATMASSPTPSPCVGAACVNIPTSPNPQPSCPPGYFAQNAATCVNPPLVVTPTSLAFTAAGAPSSLTYAVHEDYYVGAFHVSDNCPGAITDKNTSGGGSGTDSTYSVSSLLGGKTCAITVTDDRGNSGGVSVATGSGVGMLPQLVCDPQSPARAFGTDIGPDPDGIHENVSNGTSCALPTHPLCSTNPLVGTTAADGRLYVDDGNSCTHWTVVQTQRASPSDCVDTTSDGGPRPIMKIHVGSDVWTLFYDGAPTPTVWRSSWLSDPSSGMCAQIYQPGPPSSEYFLSRET